jgi:hypothetical protein
MEKLQKPGFQGGPEPYSDKDPDVSENGINRGSVDVIHGVYAHSWPIAGMKVKDARAALAAKMNIDPAATAVVDGNDTEEDCVLLEGQVLTFVKQAGEKG